MFLLGNSVSSVILNFIFFLIHRNEFISDDLKTKFELRVTELSLKAQNDVVCGRADWQMSLPQDTRPLPGLLTGGKIETFQQLENKISPYLEILTQGYHVLRNLPISLPGSNWEDFYVLLGLVRPSQEKKLLSWVEQTLNLLSETGSNPGSFLAKVQSPKEHELFPPEECEALCQHLWVLILSVWAYSLRVDQGLLDSFSRNVMEV